MTRYNARNSVDSVSIELSQAMNERKEPPRFEPYICKIFSIWSVAFKNLQINTPNKKIAVCYVWSEPQCQALGHV